MALELPLLTAALLRLPDPEVNLAALGGVAFPLAMIIEAPIINLLSASTTLSRDWASYLRVRNFMLSAGATLTTFHAAIALTPLYDLVVIRLIGAPSEVHEPVRTAMIIFIPWTWAIAFRRTNQGVLIRFGDSRAVGIGTATRLATGVTILALGLVVQTIPGIIIGSCAVVAGVLTEAAFIGYRAARIKRGALFSAPRIDPPLSQRSFLSFYIPLALTSLMYLLIQPLGSAALSRMPDALNSLAVWPVVTGLLFIFRSMGIALKEVVVSRLDEPGAHESLRRFSHLLGACTMSLLFIAAVTPLGLFYFRDVAGLPEHLSRYASWALVLGIPMPALSALNSWYQGQILHRRRTRTITYAVLIYIAISLVFFAAGIASAVLPGLYVCLAGFSLGMISQTLWLRSRAHRLTNLPAAVGS